MPRPPLAVGTWGTIARTPYRDSTALVWWDRRAWRPADVTREGRAVVGIRDGAKPVDPTAWAARARIRDADGRTRQVEAWGSSGAAAERSLRKRLAERAHSVGETITPNTRVEVLARHWLKAKVEPSKLAIRTKQAYRDAVERAVIPGVGGLQIVECSVARLDSWVKSYADRVGPASAKMARTCLKGMFALAVREDALKTHPAAEVDVIESETATEVRALTPSEVRELRRALLADEKAVSAHLPDIVGVMLATGCRTGEALALRWADVDLVAGVVYLTGTVVREKGVGLVRQDTTKGKKATGLWLPVWAVEMLEKRIATVPAGPLGLVFPSAADGLREVDTVDKQWRAFRNRHPEWSWITPKTFRKSVATEIERRVNLAAAGEQLTHSSTATTAKHYVAAREAATDHSRVLEAFAI